MDDLLAQLRGLSAQLSTLQTQRASLLSAAATTTQWCPTLTRTLAQGFRGADVVQLQQFLVAQNYLAPGNDTGYFGSITILAVRGSSASR